MKHIFEVGDSAAHNDTLILVYPPDVIRDMARVLDGAEKSAKRLGHTLPDLIRTPIYGQYLGTDSRNN